MGDCASGNLKYEKLDCRKRRLLLLVQEDLVIRGLFIFEFAYSHFKNWFKMPNFQSNCVFLSANSVFAVQNSGTYLPRKMRLTCMLKLSCHLLFTHDENACVLRTIDTHIKSVQPNIRFILSNQDKNSKKLLCE